MLSVVNQLVMKANELSKTEERIVRLKLQGLSQKEIGCKTFNSQFTIQGHLRNIYRKTEVHNEIELYNWWLENRLHIDIKKILQVIFCLFLLVHMEIKGIADLRRPEKTELPFRTETLRTRTSKREVA